MKRRTKIRGITRYIPLPWDGSSLTASFLIILSLVLIIVSVARPSYIEAPRNLITDLFKPIISSVGLPFQSLSIVMHDITSFAQIQADKARLEQENQRLRQWYQTALLLESENKSLRDLLNLEIDPKFDHLSARILSDSGSAFAKTVLLDAGRSKNVQKGAAVLSGVGLVGRVVEVSEKTSRVLLITDVNARVPVVVEGSGQNVIMAGTNEEKPKLIHLPQDSEITIGARLYTSGYGGVYPNGLPVGRVVKKQSGALGVMLFADFRAINVVRVIQKNRKNSE